jgi:hypothetical protein
MRKMEYGAKVFPGGGDFREVTAVADPEQRKDFFNQIGLRKGEIYYNYFING